MKNKTIICMAGLFIAGLALLALPVGALAEDYWWNVDSGSWFTPGNWNPPGLPTAADNAFIDNEGEAKIPFSYTNDPPRVLNLIIGSANPNNRLKNGYFLYIDDKLVLGEGTNGVGRLINENVVTVGNQAIVGQNGRGYVENYEGFTVNGHMTVGYLGLGSFGDRGITYVTHNLVLGSQPGSQGHYDLEDGQLTAGVLQVGLGGYGDLTIAGYWGTPSVEVTDYEFQAGYFGGSEGFVHQYSGTVSVPNAPLVLGVEAGSYGEYTLYGTSSQLQTQNSDIGRMGQGKFYHEAGDHLVADTLTLGQESTGEGYYEMRSGHLQATAMVVGHNGAGEIFQTGGVVRARDSLIVGRYNSGHYYAGGGTLSVGDLAHPGELVIGQAGYGSFMQEGSGQVKVLGDVILGKENTGLGSYYMNSGSLKVGDTSGQTLSGNLVLGGAGIGTFVQQGGAVEVFGTLIVGQEVGSSGSYYIITPGTVTTTDTIVGLHGQGAFRHYGTKVVANQLALGVGATGKGSYHLGDGSLTAPKITIGHYGEGGFTQDGGTLNSAGIIVIGHEAGGRGTCNLGGGQLNAQSITVGLRGQGEFRQSGGTLQVADTLAVKDDNQPTGTGSFGQTGGTAIIHSVKNWGQMAFDRSSGNPMLTDINHMTNHAPGQVEFKGTAPNDSFAFVVFMTNYGQVKVTNTTVTFGVYEEHGSYISDPALTIVQSDLTVGPTGFLVGGLGDIWQVGNDFFNTSLQNLSWNTREATLAFYQGPLQDAKHTFQIPGLDLGFTTTGFINNFAWGKLDISGQELWLADAGAPGGALYVGVIEGLVLSGSNITNIHSIPGLNLYYDPLLNPELEGRTFFLADGGYLAPTVVPLPGTMMLLLSGLARWAAARWRRPQSRRQD